MDELASIKDDGFGGLGNTTMAVVLALRSAQDRGATIEDITRALNSLFPDAPRRSAASYFCRACGYHGFVQLHREPFTNGICPNPGVASEYTPRSGNPLQPHRPVA